MNLCPYFSHFCLHNYYGVAQAHRTKLTHFCLLIRRAMCQGHSFAGITLQKKEGCGGEHFEDNKRISLNMISVRKLACQSLQACARVNCYRNFSASSTALLQVSCFRLTKESWFVVVLCYFTYGPACIAFQFHCSHLYIDGSNGRLYTQAHDVLFYIKEQKTFTPWLHQHPFFVSN